MNRRIIVAMSACLLIAILLLGLPSIGIAQTATPAAAQVKKETLGQGQTAVAPDRTLLLARRTFPAGSDSGAHPAPGPVVLYVESGTLTFSVTQGAALVTHKGGTAAETISAGANVTLNAGDVVTYDQGVVHDVRNDGTEPAVTLESRLNPTAAATPAPASATP